jgi:NADPH-dependent 2,4-dienoyl-CoA reductase/sulfur reductase-like enzyme
MSRHAPVVVVGAGMAGTRCAVTLRRLAPDRRIALVGNEPVGAYERPPLSKEYLARTREAHELAVPGSDPDSLVALGIELHLATHVVASAPGCVVLDDGRTLCASSIVLATGARPRTLPAAAPASRVHVLRSLEDARRLRRGLERGRSLAIIGSGFVGAEVASTARDAGVDVTIVEAAPVPFERTLGADAGNWLAQRWRAAGVDLRLGTGVAGIDRGATRAVALRLADGSTIEADDVLVAIGTVPNDELFHDAFAGVGPRGAGIPADRSGRTPIEGIWAAGDVACITRGAAARRVEHWTDAALGAERVARSIVGAGDGRRSAPYAWSDQFGLRIQIAGDAGMPHAAEVDELGEDTLLVRYRDEDGQLRGVAGVGHPHVVAQCRHELAA